MITCARVSAVQPCCGNGVSSVTEVTGGLCVELSRENNDQIFPSRMPVSQALDRGVA